MVWWNLKPLTPNFSINRRASHAPILHLRGSMLAKAIVMSELLTYFALLATGNGLFCGEATAVFEIFIGSTVVFFAIVVKRVPAVHLACVYVDYDEIFMVHMGLQ